MGESEWKGKKKYVRKETLQERSYLSINYAMTHVCSRYCNGYLNSSGNMCL